MRVPYNWLKEYIDCPLAPRELAERLTSAGIEVESVEPFRPHLPRVVAARVCAVKAHLGSSKLSLVTVDPGGGRINVVCGAPNVAPGQMVPLALPGAVLPGNSRIETALICGEQSQGMICSPRELGLDFGLSAEEGILVLDPAAAAGTLISDLLEFSDSILSLHLTPNRADCLSLLGVAYEVAALTGTLIKLPPLDLIEGEESVHYSARVSVADQRLCPRYTARVIRDLQVAPSPLWMQIRLLKAGIRPINNIVDITNYVMWEYGQPLHAFDYDLLAGSEIVVRRAAPGETLVTLDGLNRSLDGEVLVIADQSGPIGLAGVMGGESTGISPVTRAVLLEAARFTPLSIRRTARRYNLPSEASQRFERGINPEATLQACNRAARLMAETAGGRVLKGAVDIDPSPPPLQRITVRPHRINELLGVKIGADDLTGFLERLSLRVEKGFGGALELTIPARRADLLLEEDVAEEVARLFGYDQIPVTLPRGELIANRETLQQRVQAATRQTLIACGFFELITLSFINPAHLESLRLGSEDCRRLAITLKNPLSEGLSIMRTTLLPGLLQAVQHNFNYQEMNQLLFEIGQVYLPRNLPLSELPLEPYRLAIAITGMAPDPNWMFPPLPADFFLLKGALEALSTRLRIKGLEFAACEQPFTHPTRSAVIKIGEAEIGFIGQLHPEVAEFWDLCQEVTLCELDLDALSDAADLDPQVAPLSRYPAMQRDIAVVVSREIPAVQIERRIRQAGGALLDRVMLFDLYEGQQVPPGMRSLTYRLIFRRSGGTLTDDEVQAVMIRTEQALAAAGAELRR
jgi:phenylalanyl-tRNA synthetase beta chain